MIILLMLMCRFYSDYDDDDDDDDAGPEAGDVISIHDDDSEPESSEPASKHCRLSEDVAVTTVAMTTVPMTTGPETENDDDDGVMMMEYWQANSYSGLSLAAVDTSDAGVMFAKCPQLRDVPCLVVDLRPREMLYLPASWLYQVNSSTYSSLSTLCLKKTPQLRSGIARNYKDRF